MHELHLRYLDARLAGEAAPPRAAEVRLRARAHGRLLARDRVAPRPRASAPGASRGRPRAARPGQDGPRLVELRPRPRCQGGGASLDTAGHAHPGKELSAPRRPR